MAQTGHDLHNMDTRHNTEIAKWTKACDDENKGMQTLAAEYDTYTKETKHRMSLLFNETRQAFDKLSMSGDTT